jgi:hypothetical protein
MLNFTILFACLSMGFTSFLAILTKRDPGTVRLQAPANVLQGAVRLQGLASPTPDTHGRLGAISKTAAGGEIDALIQ